MGTALAQSHQMWRCHPPGNASNFLISQDHVFFFRKKATYVQKLTSMLWIWDNLSKNAFACTGSLDLVWAHAIVRKFVMLSINFARKSWNNCDKTTKKIIRSNLLLLDHMTIHLNCPMMHIVETASTFPWKYVIVTDKFVSYSCLIQEILIPTPIEFVD